MILDFQTGVGKQYNTIDSDYTALIRLHSLHHLEALILCMVKHSKFRIITANFLGVHFLGGSIMVNYIEPVPKGHCIFFFFLYFFQSRTNIKFKT